MCGGTRGTGGARGFRGTWGSAWQSSTQAHVALQVCQPSTRGPRQAQTPVPAGTCHANACKHAMCACTHTHLHRLPSTRRGTGLLLHGDTVTSVCEHPCPGHTCRGGILDAAASTHTHSAARTLVCMPCQKHTGSPQFLPATTTEVSGCHLPCGCPGWWHQQPWFPVTEYHPV